MPSDRDEELSWVPVLQPISRLTESDCKAPSGTLEMPFKSDDPQPSISPPPDGGGQAWLQVLGSFFIWLNTLGLISAYGEFQGFYEIIYLPNNTPFAIAWIGSTQGCAFLFVSTLAGALFDRGYLYSLYSVGTFLVTLGFMMASLSTTLWELVLAQGICIGLGMGFLWVPNIGVVSQWFSSKRSTANGLASLGAGIGGVIYPIIFRSIQQHSGFGWAIRACGFVVLVTQLFPFLLMKRRTMPPKASSLIDRESLTEIPFLLALVFAVLGYITIYIPQFYVTPWSVQHGFISGSVNFYILAIFNAATCFGRIIMAVLADRVTGVLNMSIVVSVILGLLMFCWKAVKGAAGAIIFVLITGWFTGAAQSLFALVPVVLTTDMSKVGSRVGMACAAAGLGVLVGSPAAGALVAHTKNYTHLQVFTGVFFFATACSLSAIRLIKFGLRLAVKF